MSKGNTHDLRNMAKRASRPATVQEDLIPQEFQFVQKKHQLLREFLEVQPQ